jgi:hypothetical protein
MRQQLDLRLGITEKLLCKQGVHVWEVRRAEVLLDFSEDREAVIEPQIG